MRLSVRAALTPPYALLAQIGQSSGFLIRVPRVQILESVPFAQMLELVDRPASDTGA